MIRAIPDWRQRGLVFEYAQLGDRPDWSNGDQTLVPVPVPESRRGAVRHVVRAEWVDLPLQSALLADLWRRGVPILDRYGRLRFPSQEPGFAYRIADDGGRQVAVRWCPLEPYPSDAWIANTNAIYAAWHAGMMTLEKALLRMVLRDHRLSLGSVCRRSHGRDGGEGDARKPAGGCGRVVVLSWIGHCWGAAGC